MGWGTWGFFMVAACWGGLVMWFDANKSLIPNILSLPALAVTWGLCGLIGLGVVDHVGTIDHSAQVLGGLAWWLIVVASGGIFRRHAAGAGDAKLAGSLGVLAASCGGVMAVFCSVMMSGLLAAVYAAAVGRRRDVPQGPAMVMATTLVTVYLFAENSL